MATTPASDSHPAPPHAGASARRRRGGSLAVVILAAGEGRRLAPLTSAIYGTPLPKQFAVLDGERSLLQRTVDRLYLLSQRPRVMVIVGEDRVAIAREQLAEFGNIEILAQPRNLDTAPGVLLPLVHLQKDDPDARIVYLPSDHHVARPGAFIAAVEQAVELITNHPACIGMLGVDAERAETEYGWIRPGAPVAPGSPARKIVQFIEKPDLATAFSLQREQCLWNTFAFAATATALRALFDEALPAHSAAFLQYSRTIGSPREHAARAKLYQSIPAANCSRDVFEKAGNLAVVPVHHSGWSDWGSPERVMSSLLGTVAGEALARRLSGRAAEPALA